MIYLQKMRNFANDFNPNNIAMKKIFTAVAGALALLAVFTPSQARNNKLSIDRNLSIFNSITKELYSNYVDTLDAERITRTAIDAMLSSIDPYTEYYSEDEVENLSVISTGHYGGIGAYISKRGTGRVYVSQPVWGTPAQQAGLRHGDKILAINGQSIDGLTTDRVSSMLRGQAGTSLTVDIERPWVEDSLLTFNIVRRTIEVEPVPYHRLGDDGIGFISLTTFNEQSADHVRDAIAEMKATGRLRGLILDLRGNGGGVIDGAVGIAGLFVPKGTEIVRTRDASGSNQKIYKTTRKPIAEDIPLAILINGSTASSSEILAGSMQDLDRAVIIGDRSYGKGLVQTSRPVAYGGLLKLTVARYYIPSGRLIQAIDYSHRRDDGSPMRIPDSLTTVWHTAAGREVRDGGGITPDIALNDTSVNNVIYSAVADNWIFDFANRYRARHDSVPAAAEWVIGDSIFNEFKAFIDPERFKYDRASEAGIDYLREAAEFEGYMNDSVKAQIDRLAGMLKHDLNHDLDFNRDELLRLIDAELSQRYYNDYDCLMRAAANDDATRRAAALLLDRDALNAILHPKND